MTRPERWQQICQRGRQPRGEEGGLHHGEALQPGPSGGRVYDLAEAELPQPGPAILLQGAAGLATNSIFFCFLFVKNH